eukprot:5498744-Alexandrium_andersonii.AAC.1
MAAHLVGPQHAPGNPTSPRRERAPHDSRECVAWPANALFHQRPPGARQAAGSQAGAAAQEG